jgi:hypothetical protein
MTTEKNQSAIAETRDQLSLDFSDGEYLNALSANLGMTRPTFGFTDDTWRALVKALALQFKQIVTKFHDVLEILLGPRITEFATVSTATVIGDQQIFVEDSSRLPQVGTLILDEGQATEETIDYCFIDRKENLIYLETATTFAHAEHADGDVEAPLLWNGEVADTTLHVHVTDARKITTTPVTAVVGRGTANEEVVTITAVDTDNGELTITPALANLHKRVSPSPIQDTLGQEYVASAEFLVLTDSDPFPDSGLILLAAATNSITATGGSTTSVTVTADDLTADRHAGHLFVFDGNVTAALAGIEALVIDNTASGATFKDTLPGTPASGDTFSIRVVEKYIRNSTDNSLQLTRDLVDVTLPATLEVELLQENATMAMAPIKVTGTGWDVIQVDPRNIELLIPSELQDVNDLRSASYLHPVEQSVTGTTLASGASIGDSTLDLTDATGFPPAGQLVIDSGGAAEEFLGYGRQRIVDTIAAGTTTTVLTVTTGGLASGAYVGETVYIGGPNFTVDTSRVITANTGTTITFVDPLTNDDFAALVNGKTEVWLYHEAIVDVQNQTVGVTHIATETVDYEETIVAGTALQSGDIWSDPYTFPGPYLYDISRDAPAGAEPSTTIDAPLAGPTTLAIDTVVLKTALEVADATMFPASVPFDAIVGRDTGNRETVTITDVNLKQRTFTTVAAPGSTAGDTIVPVTLLTGAHPDDRDDFPNINGYRVLLDRGGANEVVYVLSTNTGPDQLVVENTVNDHVATEAVELLADVLSVSPLDDNHIGLVPLIQRSTRYPGNPTVVLTAAAVVGATTVTVDTTIGLSSNGRVFINGAVYDYSIAGATSLNILDSGGIRLAASIGTDVVLQAAKQTPEKVEVLHDEITVVDTTGFPTTGSDIILNFGKGVIDYTDTLTVAASPSDVVLSFTSTDPFPDTIGLYEVTVNPGGGEFEEKVVVSFNNTTLDTLTIDGPGLVNSHPIGTKVTFSSSVEEIVTYTSVDGATHSPTETVIRSTALSTPGTDGYGFPFRMPSDLLFRIEFLFDLIRAAGVQVTIIEQR